LAAAAAADAAGCCLVKRYATAFIHTQMRFIGPPRTSASLHHSRPKSTSSAPGRRPRSRRVAVVFGLFQTPQQQRRRQRRTRYRHTRPRRLAAESVEDGSAGIRTRTRPTRPDAGRLICNRVGSGRAATTRS